MLEPGQLQIGGLIFVSPSNGANRKIPPIALCPDQSTDSDYDELSDRGERIVGTHPNNPDTDGDSIKDSQEILNGSDPNGENPVFTGVIASAESSTGGFSDKIIAENGLAFLGNGPDGVDCFDIGSGTQPIFLSSIDTTGTVKGLSFDPPYLAVANADLGVAVIDYTDPANPKLLHTHPTHSPANCVSLVGSILFVGLHSGEVISMDAMMGHQIDHLSFAEEKHHRSLDDLVFYQDTLYALIDAPMYRTWGSYLSFPRPYG